MSAASTPSPIPIRLKKDQESSSADSSAQNTPESSSSNSPKTSPTTLKSRKTPPLPYNARHVLSCPDLAHPGAEAYFRAIPDTHAIITKGADDILSLLYTPPSTDNNSSNNTSTRPTPPTFTPHVPGTRAITLTLSPSYNGVAYTHGLPIDPAHKEIVLSLGYVHSVSQRPNATLEATRHEIAGVLVHELVHCYQHSTRNVPGGLIEGIADFVRLGAGLGARHWGNEKKEKGQKWDEGYQKTAFFLDWIEKVKGGKGSVGRINEEIGRVRREGEKNDGKEGEYQEEAFWKELFGVGVQQLWKEYEVYLDGL